MSDTVLTLPDRASAALIVQTPGAADAVYVTATWPRAFVTPVAGTRIPQELGTLTIVTNWTESPATIAPLLFFTVAVTVEVLAPSAGMTLGAAAKDSVSGT